jgi:hypothetical protein
LLDGEHGQQADAHADEGEQRQADQCRQQAMPRTEIKVVQGSLLALGPLPGTTYPAHGTFGRICGSVAGKACLEAAMADHWLHTRDPMTDDEGAYRVGWGISLALVMAAVLLLWHFNV